MSSAALVAGAQPAQARHGRDLLELFALGRAALPADGRLRDEGRAVEALFRAASAWLGHLRGGVAMAGVGASAGFGAICGSSLATAATMGRVALPELRKHGYSGALATGSLAAGGTLGILIPPSIVLVIYAILAEQNIAKLFVAAFIPGLLAAIGYMLTVSIMARSTRRTACAPRACGSLDRIRALSEIWPVVVIFVVMIGGMNTGVFTPTEGAAVGARAPASWRCCAAGSAGRVRRLPALDRGVDRHDLLHRARRGSSTPSSASPACPSSPPNGSAGCRPRPTGAAGDPADLPGLRLRDGFAVDDPAHHPDLLSRRHAARLRPDARKRPRSGSASSS
jgi:hypothetical protein